MKVTVKLNNKIVYETDDEDMAAKIKQFLTESIERQAAFRNKVQSGGFAKKPLPTLLDICPK